MCKNFNGSHSGGSSFVNVNDCWLLQKLFVYHIWFRTLKPVRIRQLGRTEIGGVTVLMVVVKSFSTSFLKATKVE